MFVEHTATGVRLADARLTPDDSGYTDAAGFRSQFTVVWEPLLKTVRGQGRAQPRTLSLHCSVCSSLSKRVMIAAIPFRPQIAVLEAEEGGTWRSLRVLPPEAGKQISAVAPLFFMNQDGAGKTVKVVVRPQPWRPFSEAFAKPVVAPEERAEVISVQVSTPSTEMRCCSPLSHSLSPRGCCHRPGCRHRPFQDVDIKVLNSFSLGTPLLPRRTKKTARAGPTGQ